MKGGGLIARCGGERERPGEGQGERKREKSERTIAAKNDGLARDTEQKTKGRDRRSKL